MKIIFEGDHVNVLERDHWQYVERKLTDLKVPLYFLTQSA